MNVRLLDIAHARSGDKGDTANVGVIALKPEWYPVLVQQLTLERVERHFRDVITGPVERFTREIVPLVLNGPPSVTGFAGGKPKVEEIVAYWPALVDKTVVQTQVEVLA